MARHQSYSLAFVPQEFLGESLNGLTKRHGICRNLIRVWVEKYEAGGLTLENTLLKRAQEVFLRRSAGSSSFITDPVASPSRKDAE